ncbi:oocyte zinc finger protein XlCOF6-like [Pararge aegeria]|nr:oocyte zinc finger protein XlCOF6-like [Pararge aegeria]
MKMAQNIKDLCRLCAKGEGFTKDLMDNSNKNILKMIQEYVHVSVNETDDLPTKVCLSCEEKVVSFEQFVLECLKVQETLKKMCLGACTTCPIKYESDDVEFGLPPIKSEVKVEMMPEELVNVINNDESFGDDFEADNFSNSETRDESDGELSDAMTLATLKKTKAKKNKRKQISEEEKIEFKNVLKKSNLNVKDFVKLECNMCDEAMSTWSALRVHYAKVHKSKPMVFCLCGFIVRSKSVLYKHVSDHRIESRKLKKNDSDSEKTEESKYSSLNVNDFVNFTCSYCEKECKSWYSLKSHCEGKHNTTPVVRCSCGITLKSKSVLYKHVQDHKNPNVICCDKCPRITKTEAAMNKHKMRHVPKSERKFCCASCDKVFNSKDTLKSHERSHIPIEERKIYRCEICDLKFTTRSSAASHKRVVHEKIKSYVCDLCGYACGTNGELRQHRAIHSEDKPFVCRTCSKPFKTYSNLKTHMDTHEDTSYVCFVCNRVLNSRRTLRKHLLVHEDKCRHVCSYCNKAFKRRQTLKVHMYTHTGDKPLTCKWCDERFSYASTLRSHRLRCHPDKMAVQYSSYNTHVVMQDGYIKNDLPLNIAKSDVDAIQ